MSERRGPLAWFTNLGNEGFALMLLAERRGDLDMAKTALDQITTASATMRDGGNARSASYYEGLIPKARALVARLREN